MRSNLFALKEAPFQTQVISDPQIPFSEYINLCRAHIQERRNDLENQHIDQNRIIEANSPFELYPRIPDHAEKKNFKYGALLVHGLLDCPFSLKDIGEQLQKNGILTRAVLLPGHGTRPEDLMQVSYQDWIQTVRYGIESLRNEVDHVFLIGYSTGATLSLYQSFYDPLIAGIVLLAPAFKIKEPLNKLLHWQPLIELLKKNMTWINQDIECDYTKYRSLAFNAVLQLSQLMDELNGLTHKCAVSMPVLMIAIHEDETISTKSAVDLFSHLPHEDNKLLLYASKEHPYTDSRILTRLAQYPDFNIQHLSHVSLPISPSNFHYGHEGDYLYASKIPAEELVYGAYNRIEVNYYKWLYQLGIVKQKKQELTFNPDFSFMSENIVKFIVRN